jgi:transketolase C-terminal domain/subunit
MGMYLYIAVYCGRVFLSRILALRSKSIWGGVGVHVAIALMMDSMAMMQTKGFPDQFMR